MKEDRNNMSQKIKACYIHIPFCEEICSYCDFCKMYYKEQWVNKYLDVLQKEIEEYYKGETLETIYIGGGTPSCLNPEQLEKLLNIIDIFNKARNCEITIEANFENMTEEKLLILKKYGVNRLSFGLQTTNQRLLKILNRYFDKNKVIKLIKSAKELGFNNINIDLMYAIPQETLEDLKKDLQFIIDLDIEHISTYSLMIEDHTVLKLKNIESISEELDYKMYDFICNYLRKKGYDHYEISNFSKKGLESKHNMTYWENLEYYGFGLGASFYTNDIRGENTKSFHKYLDKKYILRSEIIDNKKKMEYEIMLNLRLNRGISKRNFYDKFGKDISVCYNYIELVRIGLIKENKDFIYIPENKWYVSNQIIFRFLESGKYGEKFEI